jgi:hypothetical protein
METTAFLSAKGSWGLLTPKCSSCASGSFTMNTLPDYFVTCIGLNHLIQSKFLNNNNNKNRKERKKIIWVSSCRKIWHFYYRSPRYLLSCLLFLCSHCPLLAPSFWACWLGSSIPSFQIQALWPCPSNLQAYLFYPIHPPSALCSGSGKVIHAKEHED